MTRKDTLEGGSTIHRMCVIFFFINKTKINYTRDFSFNLIFYKYLNKIKKRGK